MFRVCESETESEWVGVWSGVFGFLGARQLSDRSGGGAGTGNYGIQDQRLVSE